MARGGGREFIRIGPVGIDAGVARERGRVAEAFGWRERATRREQAADELLDLVHERGIVGIQSVPFDHREFRVVPAAALAVAKYLADLINVAAARRQQPLHRVLRRWAEIERPIEARDVGCQRLDLRIGDAAAAQGRRLDLEDSALGEEFARPREHRRPGAQRADRGARAPRAHGRTLPIDAPRRSTDPHRSAGSQPTRFFSNSKITVEPMLKRPSSAPFASDSCVCGKRVNARRLAGVMSPAQTVAMLPTLSAPTSTKANCPAALSNSVSTRSLRANRRGTQAAVAALTLKRRP